MVFALDVYTDISIYMVLSVFVIVIISEPRFCGQSLFQVRDQAFSAS
jgi:hypothetical protein